ncbi:MAG: Gfo/Idh/MocA family protein [Ktedonobacterales bacterium]
MRKVRWGVLSTARIATRTVIPAMRQGAYGEITAIASRDGERAARAAEALGIAKAYGSYEALLADQEVDAIYNPLPNHLHVPWSLKALEAGKHVLCEKPLGRTAAELAPLIEAARRQPRLKVMEAFMYRFHPQWRRVHELVTMGRLGTLRSVHTSFAYFNDDPTNVRNQGDIGGGALLDIGCYAVSVARWLFGAEPRRAFALLDMDPRFAVDRLVSGTLDFGSGVATFTCGTQLEYGQRVEISGSDGRLVVELPFNPLPDQPTHVSFQHADAREELTFDACNQYTLQGDQFSQAILDDGAVPTPLADALANARVLDALRASNMAGGWAEVVV